MNNDQNNAKLPSDVSRYNLTDFDYLVDATLSAADTAPATSRPKDIDSSEGPLPSAEASSARSERIPALTLYTEYSGGIKSEEDGESFPLPYSTDMPSFFEKRHFISSPTYLFFIIAYVALFAALVISLTVGICNIVSLSQQARPEAVIDEYLSLISDDRLYRDILLDVQAHKSAYENESVAADGVFDRLVMSDDKRYMPVISDDGLLRYDVFVGDSRLYRVVLGKKAEVDAFRLSFSFWEVLDASFYDNSVLSCMRTYRISAPADADVYLNGILIDKKNVIDNNYHFFIGSSWESETPEGARCVLYEISGLFGEPTFSAKIDGEELGIYADDEGVYHAKFPTGWVRDYTVAVPSGSVVHVNGILATAIAEQTKAPATAFESGDAGLMDVYRIEGLFNLPSVSVRYGSKTLTEHTFENDVFTYAFTEDVYHKTEIIVPAGASVSVNGVLLSTLNSTSTKLSLSEWASLPFVINSYTPTELALTTSVGMPSFVKYTVSSLYMMPNVTVKIGEVDVSAARSEISADGRGSSFAFDAPVMGSQSDIESFAIAFAKTYIKYVTEGCYGIRDDVELRKNFYKNWTEYLSYIVPDSLCFDSALDSYSDVEYRPIAQVISQSYSIQHSIRYSDDVRYCQITCTIQDSLDLEETTFVMNVLIVRHGKSFKVWMHDTLEA